MSLWAHLAELRTRLFRVMLAVLILGTLSLIFSRELYRWLMLPVLSALPPSSPSLIYTSAIEELNVLMKLGLYTGIFVSTPVILWQIWAFVSPGLLERERRFAGPFILFGTLAFIAGASFCYSIVLPRMFHFLLQREEIVDAQLQLSADQSIEQDLLRILRSGTPHTGAQLAAELARGAPAHARLNTHTLELELDALGRLLDALAAKSTPSRVTDAAATRTAALHALVRGDLQSSRELSEQALSAALPDDGAIVTAARDIWAAQLRLIAKSEAVARSDWTRPMLSMSEQLSLVLVLLLAFGIIFELPLVMLVLSRTGLVNSKFFFKYQRHAIVVCVIAAAILTPTGDVVNLSLMAVPMLLCYEIGVLLVWLAERPDRASQKAP